MAPPIPGARRPVPVHRRSAGDVVIGLLAIVALIALTAGVPFALVTIFGLPIPHSMPSLSVFSHQLDVFAVIKVLMILVWLAWIQLVFCVLVEIRAAVRNAGMPARVPLAGGTQMMVHRLVTAALLLVTATTALSPAFTHTSAAAPPPRPAAVTSSAVPAYIAPGQHTAPAAQEESDYRAPSEKIYVVKPPVGRYHESLWEIAENHLGDGRRYREIFELNKDRVQPDGSMLTMASLIRPGWVLHMPADAHGPGIEVIADGHHRHAADHESDPRTVERDHAGRHGGMTAGPVAPAPQHGLTFPDELAAASLLAAGVLAALGRRRREQLWRRAFGTRIEAPAPSAADAEVAMRLGAQEPLTWLLDTGLRYLSQSLGQEGRTPPTVVAAHLSADNLDLWVTPADRGAPAPWTAVGDGQVWRLPAAALHRLDPEQVAGALAPFPGLVSLGTDSGGRVLVDLEAAHGLICLDGPGETVTSALSAMVVELATNRWSDQMSITLVGFGQDLTQLAPDRITAVPTLAQALPALEARAAEVANAMAMAGIGSVLTGRARGGDPRTWAPHYLIMATPPSPEEQQRLLALAAIRHAAAAGYVVAGDVPGAAWTWSINGDGQLIANQLGFDVQAQLLPPRQHAALVELFAAAGQPPSAPLDPAPAGSVPQAQLVPGSVMPVEIAVLGPVSVQAPGIIEPDRVSLITELIVYLAVHPEGVHPNVLAAAVWPRGVTSEVRDAALIRATEWLGMDPASGRPHLETDPAGRLCLGPGVRVDWQVFKALGGLAQQARDGSEEEPYLAQALGLVSGQLLTGRDPGRYAWLAADDLEYEVTARVADAAHRLSSLRLGSGDAPGAMAAARSGLRLAFADELLWRDLLLAAHATLDEHLLRSVVDEVCARTALDEVLPRMAPETEALIDEICPSWRASVA